MGFPALLPALADGDDAQLHRQCLAFDQRLQAFLSERGVALNAFATVDELESYLEQ